MVEIGLDSAVVVAVEVKVEPSHVVVRAVQNHVGVTTEGKSRISWKVKTLIFKSKQN